MTDLNAIVETAKAAFANAATPADLENAKALYLGKSGRITELMKGMAALSVDEKKTLGTTTATASRSAGRDLARPSARAGRIAPCISHARTH